jgi:hypothetical protein
MSQQLKQTTIIASKVQDNISGTNVAANATNSLSLQNTIKKLQVATPSYIGPIPILRNLPREFQSLNRKTRVH